MSLMKFKINGMHCRSCVMLIQESLEEEGVKIISFNFNEKDKTGFLEIDSNKQPQEISNIIKEEGEYEVVQEK